MRCVLLFCFSLGCAVAQGTLPWTNALSAPGATSVPGVFYVSSYAAYGTHTDYDMARQAADAYAAANPWTGSMLVLKAAWNETCDAVPLPSLGTDGGKSATTSLIGYGSNVSRIVKKTNCVAGKATLSHLDSPKGQLSRGWYQGFTVDANHIDSAACEMYGMSLTTFLDIACGNAIAGADHELEFGNRDANLLGWMDNIYIYNLHTFDTIGAGKGAILTPLWTGTSLTGVTLVNGGTKKYSAYVRAQIVGPDLSSCSTIPTLKPNLDANLLVSGASITSPGKCTNTARLYILIQDGTPVTYGMKFTNMADSHAWDLEAMGTATYGEAWLIGSNNNSIYGEHPYTNHYIQIADYANGNRHINPFFDSPGVYGAALYGQTGSIQNAIFSWDGASYLAASGYYFGADSSIYQNWEVATSQCTNSTKNFVPITTKAGTMTTASVLPVGIHPRDVQACDGTNLLDWPVR